MTSREPTDPAATAIRTLAELKQEHHRLLELADAPEGLGEDNPAITNFLDQGSALGRLLAAPADRLEAQRLLDYWASSSGAGQTSTSTSTEIIFHPAVLQPCETAGQPEIANAAIKAMGTFTPSQKIAARRLLLRLLSLEKDGTSFAASPQSEKNLISGFNEEVARDVLGRFRECGLIKTSPEGLTLSSTAVLSDWPEAREWLVQRRRLRGAARFWDGHRRDPGALLEKGDILDEASGYFDLDALETTFVKASQEQGIEREKLRRRKLYGLIVVLALISAIAVTAAGLAFGAKATAEKANAELIKSQEQQEIAKKMLEENNRMLAAQTLELDAANGSLKAQTGKIQALNLALQKERDDLVVKNGELAAQRDDIARQSKETQEKLERLEAAVQSLLQEGSLTQVLRTKLNELANKIGDAIDSPAANMAQALPAIKAPDPASVLEPGEGLLVRAGGENSKQVARWKGTAGFFVTAAESGQSYILGPRYLYDAPEPLEVYRIDSLSVDSPGNRDRLVTLAPGALGGKDTTGLVHVPLPASVQVGNSIASIGSVTGLVSLGELAAGQEVTLVGLGSGIRRGKIIHVDEQSGWIYTERISTAGDAGAPVLTSDGRAVGVLVQSNHAKESQIASLDFYLKSHPTLKLLQPARPTADFDGAIVQVLVPQQDQAAIPSLSGVLDAFRAAGISIPDEGVLPRKRSPKTQTEVRYYHVEDKVLAEKIVAKFLTHLGVDARVYLVNDNVPPPKMVQISFSSPDLQKVHARAVNP